MITTSYLNVPGNAAPTAAQAANLNSLVVSVTATADADVSIEITHNWGLSAAQFAELQPWVFKENLTAALASALLSGWAVAWTDGNNVTVTKATTGGSGNAAPQVAFVLLRPHTIIQ